MYLLDAINDLRENVEQPRVTSDFELRARVHLTGVLDLDAVYVRGWELLDRSETTDPRSVFLQTRYIQHEALADLPPAPPRDEQYYFPEGLPAEVSVLLTVFTRAHFVLARSLTTGGIPLMRTFQAITAVARSPVDGKTIALGDVEVHFRRLVGLRENEERFDTRRLEPFMFACRLYHLALTLRHTDGSLAYITLVSAIEALLHDVRVAVPALDEFDPRLATLVREHCPGAYEVIEREVLSRQRFIKRRFISFTIEHLGDLYWNDPSRPTEGWARFRDPDHLTTYLSRIYAARSSALHDGIPFPPSFSVLDHNEEVTIGGAMRIGNREWTAAEILPPFRAFERIVHHVLVEYLRREAERGLLPAPSGHQ